MSSQRLLVSDQCQYNRCTRRYALVCNGIQVCDFHWDYLCDDQREGKFKRFFNVAEIPVDNINLIDYPE